MPNKAVVLLSGGLDSSTVLAIANNQDNECYCLSFIYGQRHKVELDAAARVAKHLGAKDHKCMRIDLAAFGGSALTDSSIEVPKDRSLETMESHIPVTYVPARNLIFLSFAVAYAEVLGAERIYIGVNTLDSSGYPDCRSAFIEAFQFAANLSSKAVIEKQKVLSIITPIINEILSTIFPPRYTIYIFTIFTLLSFN